MAQTESTSVPTVVIISSADDAHIDFVKPHLSSKVVVIDPHLLLKGYGLSYRVTNGKTVITYDGHLLDNVISVWYRKPQPISVNEIPVPKIYKPYSHSAIENYWHYLRNLFPDARWVSPYYNIKMAENKAVQLEIAHRLGFNTPATLFTSSAAEAKRFIDQHESLIVKSLSVFSTTGKKQKFFFTSKLDKNKLPNLAGLHLAPAIFQQAIDVAADIRVTVVGDQIYAASISGSAVDTPQHSTRDWRIVHFEGSMEIKSHKLPVSIAELCKSHAKEQGLLFSAIDLVIDKGGSYWFLENNPNGQWAFVEDETGQPIGKAVATLLEG